MKEVELTQGRKALVDDEDWVLLQSLVSKHGRVMRWCVNAGYAYNKTHGLLHRFLMQAPPGIDVDHINGNKLDCRRDNMRFCTDAQNQQNRKAKFQGYSQFKGAHWDKNRQFWMARIRIDKKLVYIGSFDTDKEAGAAYNETARKHFGEFASLNDLENTPISPLRRTRT